jgi:hypothetical protein
MRPEQKGKAVKLWYSKEQESLPEVYGEINFY